MLQFVSIVTALLYFIAHGYRLVNDMFSHDALLCIVQNDYGWQIALGRYMMPVVVFLRGNICNPWLISILAIAFQITTVYMIVRLLNIQDKKLVTLTAAFCVCNPTVITLNASFIQDVDIYALSCMLAVWSIYLINKAFSLHGTKKKAYQVVLCMLSACAIAGSLALYQAYLCVAVGLAMILALSEVMQKTEKRVILKKTGVTILAMLGGGSVYYIGWKLMQKVFHIWTADTYNGMSELGKYTGTSILDNLIECYKSTFAFLTSPDVFQSISMGNHSFSFLWRYLVIAINGLVIVGIIVMLIIWNHRNKSAIWSRILQGILLIIFPFGINVVCFISKGMEHVLMIYAFNLIYIMAIWIYELLQKERQMPVNAVFCVPFVLLLWVNFVYGNQVYLKKELLDHATQSLLNRIVVDVEDMEGYIPGETKVAIVGSFENAPYLHELNDFEEIVCIGMGKTNLVYTGLDYAYLERIMNVNMNLVRISESEEMETKIREMPYYPEQGSVCYIENTVVVKIGE